MSLGYVSQARPLNWLCSEAITLLTIRLCSRRAPAMAKISPSRYSLLYSALRSSSRYSSGVKRSFGTDDISTSTVARCAPAPPSIQSACDRPRPRLLGEALHDKRLLPAVGDLAAGGIDDGVGGRAQLRGERQYVARTGVPQPRAHALGPDLDIDLRQAAGAVADIDLDLLAVGDAAVEARYTLQHRAEPLRQPLALPAVE